MHKKPKSRLIGNEVRESMQGDANVHLLYNEFFTRTRLAAIMDKHGRDLDAECGYPKENELTPSLYQLYYDREGVATRVVSVLPEESWSQNPEVIESEDIKDSLFEQAWCDLEEKHNLYSRMLQADVLSGIGHFGIILLGINDGLDLAEPAFAVDMNGEAVISKVPRKLLYVRAFPETVVTVSEYERAVTNCRYGLPTYYTIAFQDYNSGCTTAPTDVVSRRVHWTRVIHIADNRMSSEVFGVPRMQPVLNRLMDLRKILGGAGEMFWRGAFPGYSFEVNPTLDPNNVEMNSDKMKEQMESYANGLQRYLALSGVSAKSLAPQVADPTPMTDVEITVICITLGVPKRVFMGSEEAKLASTQDTKTWNKRLERRRLQYISPRIVKPFVDRLMVCNVIPFTTRYTVRWPDLEAKTDAEKATIAVQRTQALAQYVSGGVDSLIPPEEYYTHILNLDQKVAEALGKASLQAINDLQNDEEDPGSGEEILDVKGDKMDSPKDDDKKDSVR